MLGWSIRRHRIGEPRRSGEALRGRRVEASNQPISRPPPASAALWRIPGPSTGVSCSLRPLSRAESPFHPPWSVNIPLAIQSCRCCVPQCPEWLCSWGQDDCCSSQKAERLAVSVCLLQRVDRELAFHLSNYCTVCRVLLSLMTRNLFFHRNTQDAWSGSRNPRI